MKLNSLKQKHCAALEAEPMMPKRALKDAVVAAFSNLENTVADAARNWLGGKADFLGNAVAEAYFDNEVAPLFAANPLKRNNDTKISGILRSIRRISGRLTTIIVV